MTQVATYPEKMGNILKYEENRSRGLSRKVVAVTCIANGTYATNNLAQLGTLIGTDKAPLRVAEITAVTDILGVLVHLEEGTFTAAGTKNNCVLIQRDAVLAGPLSTTNATYVGAVAKADGSGDTTATLTALTGVANSTDLGAGETTSAAEIAAALVVINAWLKAQNIRVDSQV